MSWSGVGAVFVTLTWLFMFLRELNRWLLRHQLRQEAPSRTYKLSVAYFAPLTDVGEYALRVVASRLVVAGNVNADEVYTKRLINRTADGVFCDMTTTQTGDRYFGVVGKHIQLTVDQYRSHVDTFLFAY